MKRIAKAEARRGAGFRVPRVCRSEESEVNQERAWGRPLSVNDPGSVQFKTGEKMPVAFAVWEGSRRESAGRKAVSPAWAEVKVE